MNLSDPLSGSFLDPLGNLSIDLGGVGRSAAVLPPRRILQALGDDEFILRLDYSSMSNFFSCQRKAFNYSVLAREGNKPTVATDFGKLFHLCEELRLRAGFSDATTQAQNELIAKWYLNHPVPPDEYRTADRMVSILRMYRERYADDGWPESVIRQPQPDGSSLPLIEAPFELELCTVEVNSTIPYPYDWLVQDSFNPDLSSFPCKRIHVVYTGRIDTVICENSLNWVVDHKTSSRGGREFEESFQLSMQTRGYTWAASKLTGLPIAGLLMNAAVIRKPTKTGIPTELSRHKYFYSPDSLTEWLDNMRFSVSDFITCLTRGYWTQLASSFKSPCAGCDYRENCVLPFDQRYADLQSQLYRNVTWSPLNESDSE